MGIQPLISGRETLIQAVFTTLFFAAVLFFALRPSKIMDSVGKYLNPVFLICLGILVVAALINPQQSISTVPVNESYEGSAFATGFLQGYDTLDALASAFAAIKSYSLSISLIVVSSSFSLTTRLS